MNSPPSLCSKQPWISSLVLGFGFALTGAGLVMLGVILPVLSAKWALSDDAAGYLFSLQFLGSTLGAVLTGANRIRVLRIGYGLLASSACALAFAGRDAAFPFFFFFGLGLGLAMTATSLVISDRYGNDRARMLERINFVWSAGATAAPVLIIPFLNAAGYRRIFFVFVALFLCLLAWTIGFERETMKAAQPRKPTQRCDAAIESKDRIPLTSLLPLLALAMCSVGVETSLSGWLTTYFHRSASTGLAFAAVTTSLFLLGIVLSRLAFSTRLLTVIGRHNTLLTLLWGTTAAVVLLIAAPRPTLIRAAAGLAGICVGPLYPLILSFLLERTDRGWIFAAGGVGSVIFPWLTGLVSSDFGSLRMGMVVPCGAAALMLLLLPFSFRRPRPAVLAVSRR
jgi:FHS family glucose/mannose:H+ symporter-like MFS transporter